MLQGSLVNAFYTGGGAKMPLYLTPKSKHPKIMRTPNLACGLMFNQLFLEKLDLSR